MNIDGVTCFQFGETKSFNRHKSKENLAVIHHSHILKLAFLSEITIFTGEARQGVRSDCAVSLSKPQICRTNVRWPALICSLALFPSLPVSKKAMGWGYNIVHLFIEWKNFTKNDIDLVFQVYSTGWIKTYLIKQRENLISNELIRVELSP